LPFSACVINQYIALNNHYNVTRSINLANDLTKLELHENHRIVTFDIKDLYVNIPIDENLSIIKTKLLRNDNNQITHQMLSLMRAVLSQNYFSFQQKIYQPEQGISMGSSISSRMLSIVIMFIQICSHPDSVVTSKGYSYLPGRGR